LAEVMVTRSNGEQVKLVRWFVDRRKRRAGISIPEYNARFIFTDIGGSVVLIPDGRQIIEEGKEACVNVSRPVYRGMVRWAGSILHAERGGLDDE